MGYRIKKLEWERETKTSLKARTSFCCYWLFSCPDGWHWRYGDSGGSAPGPMSLEAAKAACQADFEKTVRECIETEDGKE